MSQPARRLAAPERNGVKPLRLASLATLLLLPGLATSDPANPAESEHPLLELARQRGPAMIEEPRGIPGATAVSEAEHQLTQARPPKVGECAQAMGSAVYAALYVDLAAARSSEGDFTGAAAEFRKALDCRPRDASILSQLASTLFDARDLRGAREVITASLALDPRGVSSNRVAGNLDFVEERWADAIARFRYVAASDADRDTAAYGQLMYWLAQRRAGVAKPEFVQRTPGKGWPQPLVMYMQGQYTEAELVVPIEDGDSESNNQANTSSDERLCEALYYVGEEYWARGQPEVALEYFAALVNIKVLYFIEHGLALAEIAKLRK